MLAVSTTGCGISKKPREHWWQFWRTKPSAQATAGFPTEGGSSTDLAFGEPPAPLSPLGGAGGAGALGEGGAYGVPLANAVRAPFQEVAELETVYFDFDQSVILQDAASILDRNAAWISTNANFHIQIEGHCDERGTLEYNINLGQLRADAVREYLVMSGIDPGRLHSISYGEERPMDTGMGETSLAKNRRVQFLVYDPNSSGGAF